jgi:hypothetical protein
LIPDEFPQANGSAEPSVRPVTQGRPKTEAAAGILRKAGVPMETQGVKAGAGARARPIGMRSPQSVKEVRRYVAAFLHIIGIYSADYGA